MWLIMVHSDAQYSNDVLMNIIQYASKDNEQQ